MSTTTTTTSFDLERFARAAEERDAGTQLSMYAPDATVTIVDKLTQPGSPHVRRTREEITQWLEDLCGRDMTHRLERVVVSGDTAAFTQACSYPDGTRVLCLAMLDLRDGLIVSQTAVQEWDA